MESLGLVSDLIERSRPLKRFCELLRNHPFLVVPLFLALYGYGYIDFADFKMLSAAPLSLNADESRQFVQSSPLTFFLGYPFTTTIGAAASYVIVMIGGCALALFAMSRFATSRYGEHGNDALLMFFATPLLIVLSQFIGKSDPYVVAFLLLLATSRNQVAQVLCASLVVLSHFELGLLLLASAAFLRIVPLRTALVGAVAGALAIYGYQHYVLPSPPRSREALGLELLSEAIDALISNPVIHLVLTFGPFWLCVLSMKRFESRWLIALAATALVASSTLDFTRVFTLMGLPLIIATIDQLIPRVGDRETATPRWFAILPLLPFFQAHLISVHFYDSRMPKLVARFFGYAG